MQKFTLMDGSLAFAPLTPAHQRLPFQHVDDRLLLPMMVNAGLRSRLDHKDSTHNPEATFVSGLMAARRSEPDVWAVPESNSSGLMTLTVA
jgi:hypothetical protein